jgi:PAS domain S-box-containing protein
MRVRLDDRSETPRAENARLYSIIESIPTGVVALDTDGKIVAFNRAAEQITGFEADRVQGRSFDGVFKPGYFPNSELTFKNLIQSETATEIKTQFERNGKDRVHLSLAIAPVITQALGKIGTVLSLRDITRLNKIEEQTSRNGRLAAMGEMAVRIAHEIRNPLGSIELYATMLRDDLQDFDELKALAEHISSGVKSINNIVSNLLLFIRPDQQLDRQTIDVHEPLKDSLFFAGHLIDAHDGIDVVTELTDEELLIDGDLELLKQVFLNLILNAIQAMSGGGQLLISTLKSTGQQGAQWAEVHLADTGCGIAKTDLPKIFDPFHTTRKKGTGLGLTIVHNIIKMHAGSIDIISKKTEGTKCVVSLPLRQDHNSN